MRGQLRQNKAQQNGATEHVSELKPHSDHTRKINAFKPPTPHGDLVSPLTYTEIPPNAVSLSSIFSDLIEREYCSKEAHESIFWPWNHRRAGGPEASDDRTGGAAAEGGASAKLLNNKDLIRIKKRGMHLLIGVLEWNFAEGLQQVKGLTCPFEDGLGELGVGDSDLAEQVQVGGHHNSGTE